MIGIINGLVTMFIILGVTFITTMISICCWNKIITSIIIFIRDITNKHDL